MIKDFKKQLTCMAVVAFALSSFPAYAASYKFDWAFNNHVTTGYFTGTENGNVISDTILQTLYFDNVLITPSSGGWTSMLFNTQSYGYTMGNGWLTFDGENNNAVFVDTATSLSHLYAVSFGSVTINEYTARASSTITQYSNSQSPTNQVFISEANTQYQNTPDVTGWSVSRVGQVPEPSVLLLIASGLASLRCIRRLRVYPS